jgi:hypothetical protein
MFGWDVLHRLDDRPGKAGQGTQCRAWVALYAHPAAGEVGLCRSATGPGQRHETRARHQNDEARAKAKIDKFGNFPFATKDSLRPAVIPGHRSGDLAPAEQQSVGPMQAYPKRP